MRIFVLSIAACCMASSCYARFFAEVAKTKVVRTQNNNGRQELKKRLTRIRTHSDVKKADPPPSPPTPW